MTLAQTAAPKAIVRDITRLNSRDISAIVGKTKP
jgi:hypothetical protein